LFICSPVLEHATDMSHFDRNLRVMLANEGHSIP
jgi:2-polyprenyl-3-methyl-5-hydroxy-6-metoxy-1,4-benzoquinol methylase